ncbi:MAG TPA: O-antigen ligase family protein [Anaerolineae bacterium]|nr:O-antigen ligase family protein [Anaerolineae bacterium]HIQ12053.1 O-antigen ligase family protein [Caldilineales bacterium]
MLSPYLDRFRSQLISPDPRRQRQAILLVLLAAGLAAGLVIGVLGPIIALALTIAGVGAAVALRSPLWGLVGVILIATLLPFATMPFKIVFTPSFLDIAIFATFGVWALAYALARETRFQFSSLGGFVLLFLLLAAFSFVMGLEHARPTSNNLRQFMEMLLSIALFFVVINVVRDEESMFLLARALILGGAGAAFFGILFYVIPREATVWILNRMARIGYPGGYGALRFVEDDPNGIMRAIGTSIDPNVFGGLLILVGVFTLPQVVSKRPLFPRNWVALFAIMDVTALFLTISRGSMLGFLIGLVAIGLMRYRKLLLWGVAGALLVGVLLMFIPFVQAYIQHFIEGLQFQDRATQMRLGEYKDALTLISRYPLFGVGFTGTPEIDLYIGVSSLYLLMAEEMGLVGVAAFLLTMLVFALQLINGLRHAHQDARLEAIMLGILGAMAGLLAAGVLDHYLFNLNYPHMTALLWIMVGMGVSAAGYAQHFMDRQAATAQPE